MIDKKTKKNRKKYFKFDCLSTDQSGHKLIGFFANSHTLWQILKINQRDPDKDQGYQRILSMSRVVAIANYIKDKNPIPNCILISLDKDSKLDSDRRKILIPNKEDAGWVIDGQHRLAGAKESNTNINLFVIAFIGLDVAQQINQFVTINREAKGVPTSLYYDLLKHLPKKSDAEVAQEIASDIGNSLRKDENSPFYSRIVLYSPKKGQLSLTNFVRKIHALMAPNRGKFNVYTRPEQIRIIDNYFKALENVFPSEFHANRSTFFKTLGFGAAIHVLSTVFDLSLKYHQAFRVADAADILKKVDYFSFSDWEKIGTGSAAELQAGEDLRQEILKLLEATKESTGTVKLT